MTVEQTSTPQQFLETQVSLLEAGDTAGLSMRYAPDATFARLDGVWRGRAEIKQLFDDYLRRNPKITAMDGVQLTEDTILYQAGEVLDGVLCTAVGTLVFRDGQVWRQSVAFVPDRAAAPNG